MKKIIIILAIVVLLISMANGAIPHNEKKVKEVREKHEAKLFDIEGVSGVSHDKKEIIVYIEKSEISKKVPKVLDGIPVKFEVTGRIDALQAIAMQKPVIPEQTTYIRTESQIPVFGGISVGNPYITAGTLGMVVNGTDGNNYTLSNAHVLALNNSGDFLESGTPIWQPGDYDGGTNANEIGKLIRYIDITFNSINVDNYADAAISTLTVEGNPGSILDATNTGFYTISGTTDEVIIGDTVRKSGRTTGVTTGTIRDKDASVKVYYSDENWAVFRDQIVVKGIRGKFSGPGDSGSAVDKNGEFVGLVFAGGGPYTIVCKAEHIIEDLGITV